MAAPADFQIEMQDHDATFTEADLRALMNFLVVVAAEWRMIGVQLNFHPGLLNNIVADNPRGTVREYLLALLTKWLGSHEAKLSKLVEALRSEAVSKRGLAQEIENHFLKPGAREQFTPGMYEETSAIHEETNPDDGSLSHQTFYTALTEPFSRAGEPQSASPSNSEPVRDNQPEDINASQGSSGETSSDVRPIFSSSATFSSRLQSRASKFCRKRRCTVMNLLMGLFVIFGVLGSVGFIVVPFISNNVTVEGSEDVSENAATLMNIKLDPYFHKGVKLKKGSHLLVQSVDIYTANCENLNTKANLTLTSDHNLASKFVLMTPNPVNGEYSNYQLQGSEITFTTIPTGGNWSGQETLYVFTEYTAFATFADSFNSTNPQSVDSYSLQTNSNSPASVQYSVKETGLYWFVLSSPQTDFPSVNYTISGTYYYYDHTEYRHRCSIDSESSSCTARIAPSHTAIKSEDVCVLVYVTPSDLDIVRLPLTLQYESESNDNNIGLIVCCITGGISILFCLLLFIPKCCHKYCNHVHHRYIGPICGTTLC